MRLLAVLIVLACGTGALLGCGGASGEVFVGCQGTCEPCSSDGDCCGDDGCFATFPWGEGRCQAFPGEC